MSIQPVRNHLCVVFTLAFLVAVERAPKVMTSM